MELLSLSNSTKVTLWKLGNSVHSSTKFIKNEHERLPMQ